MNRGIFLAVLAMLASPAAMADVRPQSDAAQASIPFVNHGGIRNYRVVDDSTLLIEGQGGKWYKADLMAPCTGLSFNSDFALGFETQGVDSFDRFGSIRTHDGQRCALSSLTQAAAPAKSAPRK